jgi:hypothetical protein
VTADGGRTTGANRVLDLWVKTQTNRVLDAATPFPTPSPTSEFEIWATGDGGESRVRAAGELKLLRKSKNDFGFSMRLTLIFQKNSLISGVAC